MSYRTLLSVSLAAALLSSPIVASAATSTAHHAGTRHAAQTAQSHGHTRATRTTTHTSTEPAVDQLNAQSLDRARGAAAPGAAPATGTVQ